MTTPTEPINDLVAVAVQLGQDHEVKDRKELVDSLFSGIQFEGRDNIQWNGDVFTAVRSDELRKRLFQLFGANLSLETVDKNIQHLINMELGWLEQTSNDSLIIRNGEINADLDSICQLVMSSLSLDIVNKVKLLLQNIHTILSGDTYFGQTQQIDVNLVSKNNRDLTCIHTRYLAETKKRGIHIVWLGGTRRSVQINFSLRKIGISQSFADDLVSDKPSVQIKDGQLQRVMLPEQHALQPIRSQPNVRRGSRMLTPADVYSRSYLSSVSSKTRSLADRESSSSVTPESPSRSVTAPDMPMLSLPMPSRQLLRNAEDDSTTRKSLLNTAPSYTRKLVDLYDESRASDAVFNSTPLRNRQLDLVRQQAGLMPPPPLRELL